ncbi:MAG TPA: RNA polymerase sigma factor, partial [Elusimicrobiales bacterium]|nr:RNA polymerase sigma factor [Elusimicrobiales bacterium]
LDTLLEKNSKKVFAVFNSSDDFTKKLENLDLVNKILSLLPKDYRSVLVLRETQGLSYQEIAQILNCSLDAVKAKLRRARIMLEEKMRHFLSKNQV